MNVKLVAITKPAIEGCSTAGELISYCGRVSNLKNQENFETAPKLLSYLATNGHWSPFEMASMTIEIITTRTIARQILRHRSFSFQEFSQRYAYVQSEPVLCEARLQDNKNRQSSLETSDKEIKDWWTHAQKDIAADANELYLRAIEYGIAKEVARNVLPEGLTESRMYMAGTIRSFIHYCQLRCGNGTQKEHRLVAEGVRAILISQFPELGEIVK